MRRQQVFVCSSIKDGQLISETIEAASSEEAADSFAKIHKFVATDILGPLLKKKNCTLKKQKKPLQFTNVSKKAIYDNWSVNAFFLVEPNDYAFLVFIKRVDGKKVSKPTGVITVPIKELIFANE